MFQHLLLLKSSEKLRDTAIFITDSKSQEKTNALQNHSVVPTDIFLHDDKCEPSDQHHILLYAFVNKA